VARRKARTSYTALAISVLFFFQSLSDHMPLSKLSETTVTMKRTWWSSGVQLLLSGWYMRYWTLRELMTSLAFCAVFALSSSGAAGLRERKSRTNSFQEPRT